ncbi:MAG: hypothetical protein AAGF30_08755 [Pseudomonadota bacterium]
MTPRSPNPTLGALTALCLALSTAPAAAEIGDVDPLDGETYRVDTAMGPMTITLPPGLSVLRAKRERFRYGLRLDETSMAMDTATAWTTQFCAQFNRQAARHRIAGGGATGRNLKFNCQ